MGLKYIYDIRAEYSRFLQNFLKIPHGKRIGIPNEILSVYNFYKNFNQLFLRISYDIRANHLRIFWCRFVVNFAQNELYKLL